MIRLSEGDFSSKHEIYFEDIARETGRFFVDIAKEHYDDYLVSIEERDND
jgi:hypothetical protein